MEINKKIVLISSGQPSLNPRLVKEADSLAGAGYKVIVLYAYWNDWGTLHDQQLLVGKKWEAIRLGGDPAQKSVTWFLSRLIYKASRVILQKTGNYKYLAELSMSRSSYFLIKGAKKHKADLYIAHNLGALAAAAKTAIRYKRPYGFDAEDFHRQEINDDIKSLHFKICSYLEDKYLPSANYLTASSPLIAEHYAKLYDRTVTTVLNVFPKITDLTLSLNENKPLKLFWFSQTIGPGRGLELIIDAIRQTGAVLELHLLGAPADGYKQQLSQIAKDAGIASYNLYFYEPVKARQVFNVAAQFDLGLAAETGSCLNRNISLTNKLFTYIQCGLALVASNTLSQSAFIDQYPQIGKVYNNAKELAAILCRYNENRELLYQTKKEAFQLGQNQLNWENESKKFLNVIENALNASPQK